MPLRVHCPNGCLTRMPSSRAGKIVRCPECKSTIELNPVSESEQKSGKPIPIHARLVDMQANVVESVADPVDADPDEVSASIDAGLETDSRVLEKATEQVADSAKIPEVPSSAVKKPSHESAKPRLNVPMELSPVAIKKTKDQHKAKLKQILQEPDPIVEFHHLDTARRRKNQIANRKPVPPPVGSELAEPGVSALFDQKASWEDRVRKSNSDRVVLARFFAVSLCVVAVVNMFPALYFGYDWYQSLENSTLPRWIYLQIFLAAIHVLYAIFLFQIPDWSSLRAVSVALLVIAFLFGLTSTSLLVGGGAGELAAFLGLTFTMIQRATIWCVAMLCLSTLMSYLGGREAANWQRAEQLLEEILSVNSLQATKA